MSLEMVGILHPGAMGIYLAACALRSGHRVCYASEGRSDATQARAAEYNLQDLGSVAALCKTCSILISICPPHAAEEVAVQVITCSYKGLYLDANAIAPQVGEYGISIPEFYIENISLPEEVEKALDKRTSMGVVGDLNRYMQYNAAESLSQPGSSRSPSAAPIVVSGGAAGAGLS